MTRVFVSDAALWAKHVFKYKELEFCFAENKTVGKKDNNAGKIQIGKIHGSSNHQQQNKKIKRLVFCYRLYNKCKEIYTAWLHCIIVCVCVCARVYMSIYCAVCKVCEIYSKIDGFAFGF